MVVPNLMVVVQLVVVVDLLHDSIGSDGNCGVGTCGDGWYGVKNPS